MASVARVENLLKVLPDQRLSVPVRYSITALFVLAFFLIRLGLPLQGVPYLLFIPPVFLSAVVFDRGSGFFATALSAVLAVFAFVEPRFSFAVPVSTLPNVVVFILVCSGISVLSEGMLKALERAVLAEAAKDLLLRELSHRVKNNLAMISGLLRLQAARVSDEQGRAALEDAIARIKVMASAHEQLDGAGAVASVHMQEYLRRLGDNLGEAYRGLRPIAIKVDADATMVRPQTASIVGLLVNELVTNAMKHAFPGDRAGTVQVRVRELQDRISLVVSDDGAGYPEGSKAGLGTTIVDLLVRQVDGSVVKSTGAGGTTTTIEFGNSGIEGD